MAMRNDYLKISKSRHVDYLLPGFGAGLDTTLDEAVLPLNVAGECYNFDFSDGTLKEGYGLEQSFLEDCRASAVWVYSRFDHDCGQRQEIVMFSTEDGEVFYFPPIGHERGEIHNSEAVKLEGVTLSGIPRAVNYRLYGEDVILICSDKDPMTVWDGKNPAYTVVSAPLITSLAIHFERMFVTVAGQKNAVWFSDDLDPTNWSLDLNEGGFIEMMDERGRLNKVISYLNYIYIFRDYGISRLVAYSEQSDFSVSNLFVSSGKIYPETVCLCGDRVVFLADDGLYAFDGLSTVRILKKLGGLFLPDDFAVAAYSNGKYYLAARSVTGGEPVGCESDEYKNNSLLVYDLATGGYQISRGFDIRRFCPVFGEVFALLKDGTLAKITKNGCLFGTPLRKKWSIPKTDFARPDKQKHIKNLYIFSRYDMEITLKTDEMQKTIAIKGRAVPQRVLTEIRGVRIGADIVVNSAAAEIARVMLRVGK